MKEKLIKLMQSVPANSRDTCSTEELAEHLIQNGVIVLPCKVGDKVYRITTSAHTKIKKIQETKIIRIAIDDEGVFLFCQRCPAKSVFGKNVFFSREEAEKKLKECEKCQT